MFFVFVFLKKPAAVKKSCCRFEGGEVGPCCRGRGGDLRSQRARSWGAVWQKVCVGVWFQERKKRKGDRERALKR